MYKWDLTIPELTGKKTRKGYVFKGWYKDKTFKKKVGVTPTEYREQHLQSQVMKIGG